MASWHRHPAQKMPTHALALHSLLLVACADDVVGGSGAGPTGAGGAAGAEMQGGSAEGASGGIGGSGGAGAAGGAGDGGTTEGGSGGEGGAPPRCADPLIDCPAPALAACGTYACVDGACDLLEEPSGTPLPDPTPGDCQAAVCNGSGDAMSVVDDSDLLDDSNPCTLEACSSGSLVVVLPGSVVCYGGSPNTLGVGECQAGVQQCSGGVPQGGCFGEVVPDAETCNTTGDDDCDGLVNEEGLGCVCTPSQLIACVYTGPPGTNGVGECQAATQLCNDQGTAAGPCEGEVVPAFDLCLTPEDEDCNGAPEACIGDFLGATTVATMAIDAMHQQGNSLMAAGWVGDSTKVTSARPELRTYDLLGNQTSVISFPDDDGITVDATFTPTGELYLAGYSNGGAGVGLGGPQAASRWIGMLDENGARLWSKQLSAGFPGIRQLLATPTGVVVFVDLPSSPPAIDFGGGPEVLTGSNNYGFVKLDTNGTYEWSVVYGSVSNISPGRAVVDEVGNLYISFNTQATIDFGGGPLPPTTPTSDTNVIAMLDPFGQHVWSKRIMTGNSIANWVWADSNQAIYAARVDNGQDLGGGPISLPDPFAPMLIWFQPDGTFDGYVIEPTPLITNDPIFASAGLAGQLNVTRNWNSISKLDANRNLLWLAEGATNITTSQARGSLGLDNGTTVLWGRGPVDWGGGTIPGPPAAVSYIARFSQ